MNKITTMNLVEQLIGFVLHGTVGADLVAACENLGNERLRVVAIKLLGWLKSQQHAGFRQLRLKDSSNWCDDVRCIFRDESLFGDLFELESDSLSFSSMVSESDQAAICSFVDENYSPPLLS